MRLGSRARLTVAIGVAAAIGFVVLGIRDLNRPTARVDAPAARASAEPPRQVLLAATTRPIRTGETITADMIRGSAGDPQRFPTIAAPVETIGKVAAHDIPANTLLPRSSLHDAATLALRVPRGMRAISIDTTAEIAVAGLLRPGDRVDVQVVYPGGDAINGARGVGRSQAQTLLQMVNVLAVGDVVIGNETAGEAPSRDPRGRSSPPPPGVARTVTLALYPDQVSALSLAKSTGALYLSLRNPDDDAQPQIARAVSSGPLPERAAAMPAVAAAAPQLPPMARAAATRPSRPASDAGGHAIDLVVGGSHRVIYSGGGK